jgi:hypothetical protein
LPRGNGTFELLNPQLNDFIKNRWGGGGGASQITKFLIQRIWRQTWIITWSHNWHRTRHFGFSDTFGSYRILVNILLEEKKVTEKYQGKPRASEQYTFE